LGCSRGPAKALSGAIDHTIAWVIRAVRGSIDTARVIAMMTSRPQAKWLALFKKPQLEAAMGKMLASFAGLFG